jgi:hypothetical protein
MIFGSRIGQEVSRCGISTLMVDQLGVGEALRLNYLRAVVEAEVWAGACMSVPALAGFFPGLEAADLPDGEAWAIERVQLTLSSSPMSRSVGERIARSSASGNTVGKIPLGRTVPEISKFPSATQSVSPGQQRQRGRIWWTANDSVRNAQAGWNIAFFVGDWPLRSTAS